MNYFGYAVLLGLLGGCSSLGLVNEDAGYSMLVSDVSVPANGQVVYTIDRKPRTDTSARQYNKDNSISRSFFSWFGKPAAGTVRTQGGINGS